LIVLLTREDAHEEVLHEIQSGTKKNPISGSGKLYEESNKMGWVRAA